MMKIKKLETRPLSAKKVAEAMDAVSVPFVEICNVNWQSEYPYRPEVKIRLAYAGSDLLLNYRVKEKSVRAMAEVDNGPVWEDSCVEFFVKDDESSKYFNVECNCAGTLLIAEGEGRNDRKHLPLESLATVDRYSSLGQESFAEKDAPEEWEVSLIIPMALLGMNPDELKLKKYRANFYKCGDKLSIPHFISWQPITTTAPDFHRPEFFAPITFE